MQIQIFENLHQSQAGLSPRFNSFRELAQLLENNCHEGQKDQAPLWAPQEYHAGAPAVRQTQNISRLHAIVLDLDDVDARDFQRVVMPSLRGVEHFHHSSFSQWKASANGLVRARVCLAASRPIEIDEWPDVRERVRRKIGIPYVDKRRKVGGVEKASAALAYYVFSWPPGAASQAWFRYEPGQPIDVDELRARNLRDLGKPRATVAGMRAVASRMARSRREERAQLGSALGALASGQSFAVEGGRDTTAFMLAGILAREFPGSGESELCEVFRQSLGVMAREEPSDALTLEQIADKVARQVAERAAQEDGGGSALRERWRACLRLSGRDEAYSDEELQDLAGSIGVSREDLSSAWVLQNGPTYFALSERGYRGPYQATELPEIAERILAPADTDGVVCQEMRAGRMGRVRPSDLVARHGRVVDTVVYCLDRQESRLEQVHGRTTLHLATCPLREIEPAENARVAEWLQLLGGEAHEYLLDWLASLTNLTEPAQAVFFEGQPGAGKSMLVAALARLWCTSGPTPIDDALGKFNDRLLRCPLVFGDERLPLDRKGAPEIDRLKAEISLHVRRLEIKYRPVADLIGAVRIVLAANNREMLLMGADLTADDVEALLDRLIHIPVGPAAARFLESLSAETVRDWVEGDVIAAHVLWLAQTRHVARGRRFLIRRAPNKGLRSLATDTGLRAAICHWLTQWLTSTQPSASGLIACRAGQLEVSARGLFEGWASYDVSWPRRPSLGRISEALKPLSLGQVRHKVAQSTVTFQVIDAEAVASWAEGKGFAIRADVIKAIADRSA